MRTLSPRNCLPLNIEGSAATRREMPNQDRKGETGWNSMGEGRGERNEGGVCVCMGINEGHGKALW